MSFIAYIAGLVIFMILDYVWLAHIAKSFYLRELASHITLQGGSLVTYTPAIPLVYLVGILGIVLFVLPKVTNLSSALLWGTVFGLLMYAFYDFTNLATLKDYSWEVTLVDILWGGFAMSIVTANMWWIQSLFK
jgi:uncharacterized membrane protein